MKEPMNIRELPTVEGEFSLENEDMECWTILCDTTITIRC